MTFSKQFKLHFIRVPESAWVASFWSCCLFIHTLNQTSNLVFRNMEQITYAGTPNPLIEAKQARSLVLTHAETAQMLQKRRADAYAKFRLQEDLTRCNRNIKNAAKLGHTSTVCSMATVAAAVQFPHAFLDALKAKGYRVSNAADEGNFVVSWGTK